MQGNKGMIRKITAAIVSVFLALVMVIYLPALVLAEPYDLANGSVTVNSDVNGNRTVSQPDNNINNHQETTDTVISGHNADYSSTITINSTGDENHPAQVTLSNVNINAGNLGAAAVSTSGNVVIELDGTNTVQGGNDHAALGDSGSSITIQDANAVQGSLTATGGNNGAGIGGGPRVGGQVNITGGIVTATGGNNGAGIGSGLQARGGNITISGGKVTATGGYMASGIGGGNHGMNEMDGTGVNVTITGGFVIANGGGNETGNEAGIGGGNMGVASNNQITGGTVIANGEILFTDGTVDPTLQAETAATVAVETSVDAISDGNEEIAPTQNFSAFTAQMNAQISAVLQQISALLASGRLDLLQALLNAGFAVNLGNFTMLDAGTCDMLSRVLDAGVPVKVDYTYGGVSYRTTIPADGKASLASLSTDGVCTIEELMGAFETKTL